MVDLATQYELGEDIDGSFNGGSDVILYKADLAIVKGRPVKLISVTAATVDGVGIIPSVDPNVTTTTPSHGLATKTMVAGEIAKFLLKGRSKVTFGGAVQAGVSLTTGADGKIFAAGTSTGRVIGFALQNAGANDTGLMFVDMESSELRG